MAINFGCTSRDLRIESYAIDLLKVVGILGVMVRHLHWFFVVPSNKIFVVATVIAGELGVHIFLFCSGFGLTLSAVQRHLVAQSYWRQRFVRIYPLYLISLLIYIFFVGHLQGFNFFIHASFLHSFFLNFSHVPEPLWFMGVLFQLYFVFPPLLQVLIRSRWLFWGAIFGLTIVNSLLMKGINVGLTYAQMLESSVEDSSILTFAGIVGLGMHFAYLLHNNQKEQITTISKVLGVLVLCVGAYLVAIFFDTGFNYQDLYNFGKKTFIIFSAYFVSFFLLICREAMSNSFGRFVSLVASGSFCSYLFHEFIFYFVSNYIQAEIGGALLGLLLAFAGGMCFQKAYDRLMVFL